MGDRAWASHSRSARRHQGHPTSSWPGLSRPPTPPWRPWTPRHEAVHDGGGDLVSAAQCRKWRMPVTTIARPRCVGGRDDHVVAHRAAGLDDGGGAGLGRDDHRVREREEGVRGDDRALGEAVAEPGRLAGLLGLPRGDEGASRRGSSGRRRCRRWRRPWRARSRSTSRAWRRVKAKRRSAISAAGRRALASTSLRSPAVDMRRHRGPARGGRRRRTCTVRPERRRIGQRRRRGAGGGSSWRR